METFTAISDPSVANIGLILFLILGVLVYALSAVFLYQSQKRLQDDRKRMIGERIICILCVVFAILLSVLYLFPTVLFLFPIS